MNSSGMLEHNVMKGTDNGCLTKKYKGVLKTVIKTVMRYFELRIYGNESFVLLSQEILNSWYFQIIFNE